MRSGEGAGDLGTNRMKSIKKKKMKARWQEGEMKSSEDADVHGQNKWWSRSSSGLEGLREDGGIKIKEGKYNKR